MIYVVICSSGEYSDRSENIVKAFKDEKKAREFVEQANTFFRLVREEVLRKELLSWNNEVLELQSYINYRSLTGLDGYIDIYSNYFKIQETELVE